MNSNHIFYPNKNGSTQRLEKGGNPYLITSVKDFFEIFHFGAWIFIGLQLSSVFLLARFSKQFFGLDPFLVGGVFLVYCLVADGMAFLTKLGMHYEIHQRAALHVCMLTILPVGMLEVAHRLLDLVRC